MDPAKRDTLKHLTLAAAGAALPPSPAGAEPVDDDGPAMGWLSAYDPVWTHPSRNAGESMPCGAGDIGLNVWVEGDDILFYVARSGAFDESNSYLKLGRVRLSCDPSPFAAAADFRQALHLKDGEVVIVCGGLEVVVWADVLSPTVHVQVNAAEPVRVVVALETWRIHDRDYAPEEMSMHRAYDGAPVTPRQSADEVAFAEGGVLSVHTNRDAQVFDLLVEQQGLQAVKSEPWNPLLGLTFGVLMEGDDFAPA